MVTHPRIQEIKKMNPQERAELIRSHFETALERAKGVQGENGYTLAIEVEAFVGRYNVFAGWSGEDGEGM